MRKRKVAPESAVSGIEYDAAACDPASSGVVNLAGRREG